MGKVQQVEIKGAMEFPKIEVYTYKFPLGKIFFRKNIF